MCLVDKKQFRCAEGNLPIYKVVRIDKNGIVISPFRGIKLWRINNIAYHVNPYEIGIEYVHKDKYYMYDSGFFHAFIDKNSANSLLKEFSDANPGIKFKVVTGYIPEGTRYALNELLSEICARKMILNL